MTRCMLTIIALFAFSKFASAETYYERSQRFAEQAPKVGPTCASHMQILNGSQLQHVDRFGKLHGGYTITDKEWSARYLKSVLFTTNDNLSCRTRPGWAIIDCIDQNGRNISVEDRNRPTLGSSCTLYYSRTRQLVYPAY